ncbi:hypothetical protein M0802_016885 [Mischocyttarus mexicanus]|nr:hypothetical protein M0802_016885 [Mischocyttarus mexicanus]
MSTLSGISSKGEKGKSKFQSLDINNLYRVSRGESLEQHQQKNTLPRKHGMQTLGRVPSARRPPANLPSLKSETSSSDPAVSLVPSGGSGWATTKDSGTSSTNTTVSTTATTDSTTTNLSPVQCVTGQTAPASIHPLLPGPPPSGTPHSSDANNKSSWSAIMSKSGDVKLPEIVQLIYMYAHCGSSGWICGARGGRKRGKKCPWAEFPCPPVPAVPTRVSQSQRTALCLRLQSEPDSRVLGNIQCDLSRCPTPLIATATAIFPQPLRWDAACLSLLDFKFYSLQ